MCWFIFFIVALFTEQDESESEDRDSEDSGSSLVDRSKSPGICSSSSCLSLHFFLLLSCCFSSYLQQTKKITFNGRRSIEIRLCSVFSSFSSFSSCANFGSKSPQCYFLAVWPSFIIRDIEWFSNWRFILRGSPFRRSKSRLPRRSLGPFPDLRVGSTYLL